MEHILRNAELIHYLSLVEKKNKNKKKLNPETLSDLSAVILWQNLEPELISLDTLSCAW